MTIATRSSLAAVLVALCGPASAQAPSLDGVTLAVASPNDRFAAVMADIVPQFERRTGAEINLEIMSYPQLLKTVTDDFTNGTGGYDIAVMDIVWAGELAEENQTVELADYMQRDADELDLEDIYPVALEGLGQYDGRQIAYPFVGYANALADRTDLKAGARLEPPATMTQFVRNARLVGNSDAAGTGSAAAPPAPLQNNAQLGGSILDEDVKPALNSPRNVEALQDYKTLFETVAAPDAASSDASMPTWAVNEGDADRPSIVGKNGVAPAPVAQGIEPANSFGGWGLAINADIPDARKEAAWAFIKWITSPDVQIEMVLKGSGGVIRRSTTTDDDVVDKYPYMRVIAGSIADGNGEYRPRVPQYPQIQEILGTAVNAVLTDDADPRAALDAAQEKAERLF